MRSIVFLAGALVLATPTTAAAVTAADPATARVATARVDLAQFVVRERYRDDWRDRRRAERRRWDRRWDGYTGQICRTRVVHRINRFGERVRRVVRTCY